MKMLFLLNDFTGDLKQPLVVHRLAQGFRLWPRRAAGGLWALEQRHDPVLVMHACNHIIKASSLQLHSIAYLPWHPSDQPSQAENKDVK